MQEAVIVSTVRTPIGKAQRGLFNDTTGVDLVAPLIPEVLRRAGVERQEVEEVVLGCGYPEGTTGGNLARASALRAGLPVGAAGVMISRFCASGLEAVAHAARRVMVDQVPVAIAGGVESISLVGPNANRSRLKDPWLAEHVPGLYASMIETADTVAARYGVTREMQDEFALESQKRTAAAQAAGHFADEILPTTASKIIIDKATGETRSETVMLEMDEGNRPRTTLEALANLQPVQEGKWVTAGNASQLSDGASVNVIMSSSEAEKRGLEPLGAFRAFASAGCEPDEMGIGPVFAVPRLLKRCGLTVDDIDLWELNEAFASQAIYCRDRLGIPSEKLNVNGGAISIGHPYGMSGSRMIGHILLEGRRRGAKWGIVTMCVAGGHGCAGLVEIF